MKNKFILYCINFKRKIYWASERSRPFFRQLSKKNTQNIIASGRCVAVFKVALENF